MSQAAEALSAPSPQAFYARRLGPYRIPESAGPMIYGASGAVAPAPDIPDPQVLAAREAALQDPYSQRQAAARNREAAASIAAAVTKRQRDQIRKQLEPIIEQIIDDALAARSRQERAS